MSVVTYLPSTNQLQLQLSQLSDVPLIQTLLDSDDILDECFDRTSFDQFFDDVGLCFVSERCLSEVELLD